MVIKSCKKKQTMRIGLMLLGFCLMLLTGDISAYAEETVDWPGAYNHEYGNAVVSSMLATNTDEIYEKWKISVGSQSDLEGYYAGQTVIVGEYLYITGKGYLYQIDLENGEIVKKVEGGSTSVYYDYLAYGDGMIFVSCPSYIQAFDAKTLEFCWQTSTGGQHTYLVGGQVNYAKDYGLYRPIVYQNGYLFCGKNAFKTKDFPVNSRGYNKPVWSISDEFNRSAGVVVGDCYYVSAAQTVYAVRYETGEILDQWKFSSSKNQATWSGVVYNETNQRLYWGSYIGSCVYSVQIGEDGMFVADSAITQKNSQKTVGTPVIYGGRVYLAGENGSIDVLDADTLERIYTNRNNDSGKVQSTPILTTAYLHDDPKKPGHVYLYYQGCNQPGTIFVMEDWQGNRQAQAIQKAAVPSLSGVSSEQIAVDQKGDLYAYNESGYLFGFKSSGVWLEELTVAEAKKPMQFNPKKISYECVYGSNQDTLTVQFKASAGGIVTINGKVCEGSVTLPKTTKQVSLEVSSENPDDKRTRVYTIQFRQASADAALKNMQLGKSKEDTDQIALEPKFSSDQTRYDVSYTKDISKLWLTITLSDPKASLQVKGKGLSSEVLELKDLGNGTFRCTTALQDDQDLGIIRIQVTADDEESTREYVIHLSRADEEAPVLKKVKAVRLSDKRASVVFQTTEAGEVYYRTAKAGENVVSVATSGTGIHVKAGENTLAIEGMKARETYIYLVLKDAAGNESNLLKVPVDLYQMNAPVITGAKGIAYKKIQITWQTNPDAAGYRLYRKKAGGGYSAIAVITNGSVGSYVDSTAQPGVSYTYTLQAYRTIEGSRYYSDYGKTYRTAVTWYPGETQLKSVKATDYSSVTIRWKRQSAVTGFYVYRKVGSGSYSKIAMVTGADQNTYVDTKAPCGTKCTYMVRAYRKNGSTSYMGYYSESASATPKLSKPDLFVRLYGYKANLTWDKVNGATGYEIYMKKGNGDYKRIENVKKITLKQSTTYAFKVRAYRVVKGKKVYSPYSSVQKVKL